VSASALVERRDGEMDSRVPGRCDTSFTVTVPGHGPVGHVTEGRAG
jgi:hypothetical protein